MRIKVQDEIMIQKDIKAVFEYIANLENDKVWRKEINSTTMSSLPQINAIATESTYLSKRVPDNILNLICTEYFRNRQVVYQTIPDSKFFLKSTRQVEAISQNETKVLYSIEFDPSIARHGLGFTLPAFIVKFAAKQAMKKYLSKLKEVLINKNT